MSEKSRRSSDAVHHSEARDGLRALLGSRLRHYVLPASANHVFSLGGVAAFLFVVQLVTGAMLLLHYTADPEQAFDSVRRIMREVPYGWLIRLVHVHGAHLMVIAVLIHFFHVAFRGSYKQPRELTWMVGCLLFALTLGAALTGYILPWTQVSFWATTTVTASIESVPFVGRELMSLVRGGELVGAATFRRALAAHVALIPLAMLVLIALHFALIRRDGLSTAPRRGHATEGAEASVPLYPNFVIKYAILITSSLIVLFMLVFFAPGMFATPESLVPADPFNTPAQIRPEWYFLWVNELAILLPAGVAYAPQIAVLGLLFVLPFLDRSAQRHPLDRPWVMGGLILVALALISLTLMGLLT